MLRVDSEEVHEMAEREMPEYRMRDGRSLGVRICGEIGFEIVRSRLQAIQERCA
jgi:hypothetical protein